MTTWKVGDEAIAIESRTSILGVEIVKGRTYIVHGIRNNPVDGKLGLIVDRTVLEWGSQRGPKVWYAHRFRKPVAQEQFEEQRVEEPA
jgi:hypothetical protein